MEKEEYAKRIQDLYQSFFERTISKDKENHLQFGEYTDCAFITLQDTALTNYVRRRNPNFKRNELTDYQQTKYDEALILQLSYVLGEGDLRLMSGYDLTTNTALPQSELEKRAVSRLAKDTLASSGLLYSGASGGDHTYCRRPWRY